MAKNLRKEISRLESLAMSNFLKKYWIAIVVATFFIPVNTKSAGKERLSGFILRQVTTAISDTFSFGDVAEAQVVSQPVVPAAIAPQQTAPPTATAPIVSSRENVAPKGELSPVTEITTEDGTKVRGQWLLAGDGGIAHHVNPQIALNDIQSRIPGNWLSVPQPNGQYHFFKRQS